jgi:hypothetical protein
MNAVVTLCLGERYESIAELTHPTLRDYADRIGAEFVVLKERQFPSAPAGYEKLQLGRLLDGFERIIFLDTDLIVRPDMPDLFRFIPEGWFGAFDEGAYLDRRGCLPDLSTRLGLGIHQAARWGSRYYNTGVMVLDRSHRDLFRIPSEFHDHFGEQTYLNLMLNRYAPLDFIKNLGPAYNRMSHMDAIPFDFRHEAYCIHYAGTLGGAGYAGQIPEGKKLEDLIQQDLGLWGIMQSDPGGYHFKRKIKISVGGGLGDQIDAEPVVREIRRLYPHDHLIVASHWPEIFKNLEYPLEEVVDIRTHLNPPDLAHVFHTYADPSGAAGQYMTHVMMNSTDFSSLHTIRRQLPPDKKEIKLRYRKTDLDSVRQKLGDTDGAFILHPGRSWRTKTLPAPTWERLIELLLERLDDDTKLVIIGKDDTTGPNRGPDRIGLTDIRLPKDDRVLDARDILSIHETLAVLDHGDVLISNDSSPIHLAGATDIWIAGIFTAKHPSFVLPFRNGTQSRSIWLNEQPSCWPCNVNAVTTREGEVRADHCLNFEKPFVCQPTADAMMDRLEVGLLQNERQPQHGIALMRD